MYRNILLFICGLFGSISLLHAQKLVKAGMGYSSTSVNTAIFRQIPLPRKEIYNLLPIMTKMDI